MAESAAEDHPENPQLEQPEPREEAAVATDGDEGERKKPQPPSPGSPTLAFNIWPPSQRTREAVFNRLVQTLAKESILSKRYGTIPNDEASALARQIEEEAFSAAAAAAAASPDVPTADDAEIEMLQMYSKEISKRMLSTVKARASASSSSPASASPLENPLSPSAAAPADSEEAPSVNSEPL